MRSLADFAYTTKADALFARLKDKPIADFAPVLTLLGFSGSEIDVARNGTPGLGWHRRAHLDSDPALEHVVHLQAVVDPQGDASQGVTYEHYVAVLDQGAQGLSDGTGLESARALRASRWKSSWSRFMRRSTRIY